MTADFEKQLSELLHAATPEPPAGLAPPTVATLTSSAAAADHDAGPGAALTLVDATRPADPHSSRRARRFAPLLAAAAVAALAAGVAGIVAITGTGGAPSPGQPAASPGHTSPAQPTAAPRPSAPRCANAHLVVSAGNFIRHGATGSVTLRERNLSDRRCAVELPKIEIGTGSTPATTDVLVPAPAGAPRSVTLPAHERLLITARLRVGGRCRHAALSSFVRMSERHYAYGFPLGVTGCTLRPLGWSYGVRG